MTTHSPEAGDGATDRSRSPEFKSTAASAPPTPDGMTEEQLRAEVERLRERERQIVELLNAGSPDRLMHDLRNLLNEVQLLRILAEQGNA